MAVGANFHADIAPMRGTGLERMAAGADDVHFVVSRMDSGVPGILLGFRLEYIKTRNPRDLSGSHGGQVA